MYVYEIGNPLNLFLSGVGTKCFIVFAAQSVPFVFRWIAYPGRNLKGLLILKTLNSREERRTFFTLKSAPVSGRTVI